MVGFALWVQPSNAQINVNVNLGSQPQWGPSGYNHVDYYYLPDIETYYYVPQKQFVYRNNGQWAFTNSLPAKYSGYNLYNGYKVVLNTPKPYLSFDNHKVKYAKYKGVKGKQVTLKSKPYGQVKKASVSTSNEGNHGNDKANNGKGKGKH